MFDVALNGLEEAHVRLNGLPASLAAALSAKATELAAALADRVKTFKLTGGVKYAAIQEFGGQTAAHEILPIKARALAFMAGRGLRFARKVAHPGSIIPERSYLRSSLAEMSGEIAAALSDAAAAALERP